MHLRLTVGIPTLGARPERLDRAIGSALAQTVPVRVLVSHQGDNQAAADVCDRYETPLVRRVVSPAKCLWENWRHAADSCDTEVFAWLQDDDVLAPHFAKRVLSCLDSHPEARTYVGRLGVSYNDSVANWWEATGPMIPMDLLRGAPGAMNPETLASGAFFTSHALSPAVAFRRDIAALGAVANVPPNADLFAERSILAELATLGPAVCDPAIVGYWTQHESNESRKQNLANDGPRQYAVMCRHVAGILETMPHWPDALHGFLFLAGLPACTHFHKVASDRRAEVNHPTLDHAIEILEDLYPSLKPKPESPPEASADPRPNRAVDSRPSRARKAVRQR